MVIEFLEAYGIGLALAVLFVVMAAILISCSVKIKRLERAVFSMQKAFLERMEQHDKSIAEEQKKERRLLNESMSNLSESVTRAVFSIRQDSHKGE